MDLRVRPGTLALLRARHGRVAAKAVLAVLAVLIVHDGWLMVRNQRELRADERLHVSPRDLESIAFSNHHYTVYGRIAIYYFLRRELAGATLTVPPSFANYAWEFEHVGLLDVVVASGPILIGTAHVEDLRRRASEHRRFRTANRRCKRRCYRKLHVVRDPRATRYVLASSDAGELFVLAEADYPAVAASPAATP